MLVVAALAVAGCATPAMRIKHNSTLFATFSQEDQNLIKQGRIALGFTPDMVKIALGEPDYIVQRTDQAGTTQTWRYVRVDSPVDYGFYGTWGWGPYYSPYGGYRHMGFYGWPGYYTRWSTYRQTTDYMRVTFRDSRVVEINQAQ